MIAEVGLAALWLAAALAALQLALGAIGLSRGGTETIAAVRPVAIVQGALALLAMAALITLFLASDMSVKLVVENSHSAKPWIYKFAGAWGNHEGSMLLWVTILGLAGGAVAVLERRLPERTLIATLAAQAGIALGFYAFLLFASNPFARLPMPARDGMGLNPLLQDPGLAFHPPTLYIGYVGISVAFSFAVGALITRDVGPAFARAMRPWVLGAWVFLTLGITAGSYWAYYELGWGGWWFWDPVENASLMPWLAATALLHSVTVLATRDGLRAWTVMLAVVAFSMSMIGTFLVRSGILTSVHAFAVDPERGAFILALLAIYIGGALALFAARIGTVRAGTTFELVSREGGLVLNNLLLSVILGIVLIGTLYPLVAAGFGVQLSVGPPFFNKAAGPVALALVVVMAAGPLLRWRRDSANALLERMMWPVAAAGFTGAGLVVLAPPGVLPLFGLSLAAGLAVASVLPLLGRNPWRTPLFTWGMVVAHLGIAVSLAGMACDAAYTSETLVAARVGQPVHVGPFTVRLQGVRPVIGQNWSALEARLSATRDDDTVILRPQSRFFSDPVTTTSESAILTLWDGQLYTVLGQPDTQGRWQLRLWWKPFVTLIWLGGALVALGGALSLIGRWRRERRSALREGVA
ncbi:c-type cytochrome biogenesis protein CcmF [Sphingomonas melonis TY]|mgnify:FL=1|nr:MULTISPECIES: heme lyase CcmF/NrfE family subunit [Sphingomonas]MBI0532682.1 heme lyase CcmF/NrfE family subunit [Sphingomonas sp. TX0522]ATI54967.1 heme lyase NrfEFG subunit NrfE [Sphingomonas melonis]KZB96657.1 c-type cytochrome biogenesis protein CcmF [Sphingomonas melonis TY]MBX8843432.1 heme lyase CcmF/NrfE family subunit [Sphingomonas melonis]MBX8853124.1 heme lyase CcmF/NrfE family subunit [Sphingomonas melonis]